MAAGQGFKTFTTGEVLTAGDVNGYLMQGINVFANATARDAAITAPAEGQFAFTKDNNSLWYYDGAAWVASGATGDIEGVSVTSPITGGGTSGTVTIGIDSTAVVPSQTGNAGKYLTTDGTTSSWGTVASGALTWTNRQINAPTTNVSSIRQIEYNGTDLYVAVADSGDLYTSPDAITWTIRTSGFGSNSINGVGFGNGLWVAVGDNATITTSSDGITWTARTSNMGSNRIFKVIYANSIWVAVGDGGSTVNTGGITYSTDGITWTRKSQSVTIGNRYYAVGWNGTHWLVGGEEFTNNALYATTPSGTWTPILLNTGTIINIEVSGSTFWFSCNQTSAEIHYVISVTAATFQAANTGYSMNQSSVLTKNWRIFNNRVYTFGAGFITNWSTTLSFNRITPAPMTISPLALSGSGSNISGTVPAAYVNATGIVLGGAGSTIFTSF